MRRKEHEAGVAEAMDVEVGGNMLLCGHPADGGCDYPMGRIEAVSRRQVLYWCTRCRFLGCANSWNSDALTDALTDAQKRARSQGKPVPARLAPDTPLFTVPAALIKILNRDLLTAGIAKLIERNGKTVIDKRDERGRTVDVHALRHTFGTHLSKGGVAPRTAQAAMRHGTLELTMSTYTDPKLLDVVGALDALPDLPLDDDRQSARAKANGTDDCKSVPMLVPNSGNRCTPWAFGGKIGETLRATGTDVSVAPGCSSDEMASEDKLRVQGLEPWTHGLKGRCSTD